MSDIAQRLLDACVGLPNAKIPWPHRILHDAHDEIIRLRAELTRRQLVKDEDDETIASLRDRVAQLEQALELIAAPKRKDGTHNRSREACEQLARAALNPAKAGTSVCRHSVPTDRKCLDCAVLNASPDGEKGKGV